MLAKAINVTKLVYALVGMVQVCTTIRLAKNKASRHGTDNKVDQTQVSYVPNDDWLLGCCSVCTIQPERI